MAPSSSGVAVGAAAAASDVEKEPRASSAFSKESSSRPGPPRANRTETETTGTRGSDSSSSLFELCGVLEQNLLNMGRALSCSICHSTTPSSGGERGAVMLAECVHLFCPGCIQMFWREAMARNRQRQNQSSNGPPALSCPVCRHPATRRSLVDVPDTYRQAAMAYKHLLRAFGMAPMVYSPHLFMTQVEANQSRGRPHGDDGYQSVSDPPSLEGARANYLASIVLASYQRSKGNAVAIREQNEVVRVNRGYYRSRLREEAVAVVKSEVAGGSTLGLGRTMSNNDRWDSIAVGVSVKAAPRIVQPQLQSSQPIHTSHTAEDRVAELDPDHRPVALASADGLGDATGGGFASSGPSMTQDSCVAALRDQCAIDAAWEEHSNELDELETERQEVGSGPVTKDGEDRCHDEAAIEETVQPPSESPLPLPSLSQVTPHTACDRRQPPQQQEPSPGFKEPGMAMVRHESQHRRYAAARGDPQRAGSLLDSSMNEDEPDGYAAGLGVLPPPETLPGREGRGEGDSSPSSHNATPFLHLQSVESPANRSNLHAKNSPLNDRLHGLSSSPQAATRRVEIEAAQQLGCNATTDRSITSGCAKGDDSGDAVDERTVETGAGVSVAALPTDAMVSVSERASTDDLASNEEPPQMAQDDSDEGGGVRVSPDEAGVLKVGTVVHVTARTWPGMNKQGGVGRVTKVLRHRPDGVSYNIRYVLGGAENHVDAIFVRQYDDSSLGTASISNEPASSAYSVSGPSDGRDVTRDAEAAVQRKSHRLEQHKIDDMPPSLLAQLAKEGFDVAAAAPIVQVDNSISRKRSVPNDSQPDQTNALKSRRIGSRVATFVQRQMPLCAKANAKRSENEARQGNSVFEAADRESKISAPTPPPMPPPLTEYSNIELCQRADRLYHERFISAISKGTVYVVASSLGSVDKAALDQLCREAKSFEVRVKRLDRLHSKKTTLCLVPADTDLAGLPPDDGDATDVIAENRTFKSMQAALAGVPLVNTSWIRICREQNAVTVPLPSMWIRSLPCSSTYTSFGVARLASRLDDDPSYHPLSGFVVHCCGLIPRQKLADLTHLLKEAGASLMSHSGGVLSHMNRHTFLKSPTVVMVCGINVKLSSALESKVRELPPGSVWLVGTSWAFDCISAGQALGPSAYEPLESGKQARELWRLSIKEI